jgi:CBS domain-containing protein
MSLRVRDVMTPDPSTVSPDTLLTTVADEIIEERYSGIPVVDEGEVVGLVEVGDLLPQPDQVPFSQVPVLEFQGEWIDEAHLEKFSEDLQRMKVHEVMRPEPLTAKPKAPLGKVIRKLLEDDSRRLLVIDEDGDLVGVVTRTDLLRAFSRWP